MEHALREHAYYLSVGYNYKRRNVYMHGSLYIAANVKHLVLIMYSPITAQDRTQVIVV